MNFVAVAVEIRPFEFRLFQALDLHYGERKGTPRDFSFPYHPIIHHSHKHPELDFCTESFGGARFAPTRRKKFRVRREENGIRRVRAKYSRRANDSAAHCFTGLPEGERRKLTAAVAASALCSKPSVPANGHIKQLARVCCSLSALFCQPERKVKPSPGFILLHRLTIHHSTCSAAVPRR